MSVKGEGFDERRVIHGFDSDPSLALCGAAIVEEYIPAPAQEMFMGCDACAHLSGSYFFPSGKPHQLDGSCCGKHYALETVNANV